MDSTGWQYSIKGNCEPSLQDRYLCYADAHTELSGSNASIYVSSRINRESGGLSFNKYTELVKTAYSGSTYVSYPTGVAAGILIYYSLLNKKRLSGVILSENLPELFEHTVNDIIKRELGNYKINLINQIK
jgi:hypothetical protein